MTALAAECPSACDEGWICEQHPDLAWPHSKLRPEDGKSDDCAGPGMPCKHVDCPYWPQRWLLMDGSGRNWVVPR